MVENYSLIPFKNVCCINNESLFSAAAYPAGCRTFVGPNDRTCYTSIFEDACIPEGYLNPSNLTNEISIYDVSDLA